MNYWNGEGLPPVGIECEFYCDIDEWCWRDELKNGAKVKIISHEGDVAVFVFHGSSEKCGEGLYSETALCQCFRQIKTADPRREVLEKVFDMGVDMGSSEHELGLTPEQIFKNSVIRDALGKLDNLPPF